MSLTGQLSAVHGRRGVAALAVALLLLVFLPAAGAQAAPGIGVDLEVLVVTDSNSQTLAITTQLDREGVPYTAVSLSDAGRPVIDSAYLVDSATGRGRFQAIVLPNQYGGYASAILSPAEVTALHDYERTYGVRQVNASIYPSTETGHTGPPAYSGSLDGAAATVTSQGIAGPFTYLKGPFTIDDFDPAVSEVYGYVAAPSTSLLAGESFTSMVDVTMSGQTGSLIGVFAHDFREELEISAVYNSDQQWFNEVAHGIVTWMTRGIHLGYHRNFLSVHVDDVFLPDSRWNVINNCTPGDVIGVCEDPSDIEIRMIPADVDRVTAWQQANDFRFDMVFNAQGSVQAAEAAGGSDPLTQTLLANKDQFSWVNHTYSHTFLGCIQIAPEVAGDNWHCATPGETGPYYDPDLVPGSETTSGGIRWLSEAGILSQIQLNQQWAVDNALPNFDPASLVTGEHAGLLTVPQQPIDNPFLAGALATAGVTFTASDASRETDSRLVQGSTTTRTVPRHPMNIFYNVATYGEEVDEYNWIYTSQSEGGSGICDVNAASTCITPLANADATQAQASFMNYIVPIEVRNAYRYVISGDPRPFYAHQSNFAEDAVLLPVVKGVLDQYKGTYNATKSPIFTVEQVEAGQSMTRLTQWNAGQDDVTAYIDAGGIHVSEPGGAEYPLTVPTGTTLNGPVLASYDGELSGWNAAPSSDTVIAVPTIPMGGYVGHTAPTAPLATATPAYSSALVSWTMPAGDGNSPVTGYGVDYSIEGSGTWTTAVAPVDGLILMNYKVTGLTNGTSYVFRVNATNILGVSEWSATSSAVTPRLTAPAKVKRAVGSDATSNSIKVSWVAPDDRGFPISSYMVRRSSDGGVTWLPGYTFVTGNPAATSVTVSGLTAGTQYVFQVGARNANGWANGWSASSSPVSTLTG